LSDRDRGLSRRSHCRIIRWIPRIPNCDQAVVDERKITGYLLAVGHPAGRAKAAFFRRHGFRSPAWEELRDMLLEHAASAAVVSIRDTQFGRKYIVEGRLRTPGGRSPIVRSVWFITTGETAPRLVTAYPASGARE
jgi:hypothetical protein